MACRIVDTFDDFLRVWPEVADQPADVQLNAWRDRYMSRWPELLNKQLESYTRDGFDWRQIALERILPHLTGRVPSMRQAHPALLRVIPSVCEQASRRLGYDEDASFVIYVGIGLGAGWATTYRDQSAILLGLENIAECGWCDAESLEGMLAHETGHLYHYWQRRQAGLAKESGPLWDLCEEGFAQRCEHVILGEDRWHMALGINAPDWADWCRVNLAFLATEFLRRVDAGEPTRDFFGHWLDIQGRRECGYFLGHEIIRHLERHMSLAEIATLTDPQSATRDALTTIVAAG